MAYKRSAEPAAPSNEIGIDLDNKKRVTVRKFNNVNLIDIREFYVDKDGVQRPGKKGISLTEDAYYKLLEATNKIQNALDELNGGPLKKKVKVEEKKRDPKPVKQQEVQVEEEEISDADE